MKRHTMARWIAFVVGLVAFLLVHYVEWLMWNVWFGGMHEPWFLNAGRAVAVTTVSLLVASMVVGALQLPGLMFSAGAFVAMTGVLVLKQRGPGNIFPIAMAFGGILILGTGTLGAWIGREIAGVVRGRR